MLTTPELVKLLEDMVGRITLSDLRGSQGIPSVYLEDLSDESFVILTRFLAGEEIMHGITPLPGESRHADKTPPSQDQLDLFDERIAELGERIDPETPIAMKGEFDGIVFD